MLLIVKMTTQKTLQISLFNIHTNILRRFISLSLDHQGPLVRYQNWINCSLNIPLNTVFNFNFLTQPIASITTLLSSLNNNNVYMLNKATIVCSQGGIFSANLTHSSHTTRSFKNFCSQIPSFSLYFCSLECEQYSNHLFIFLFLLFRHITKLICVRLITSQAVITWYFGYARALPFFGLQNPNFKGV